MIDEKYARDFLVRFGYAPASLLDDPAPDMLSDAVWKFQQFYALEETKALDEATYVAMLRPRCGMPDIPAGEHIDAKTVCWWRPPDQVPHLSFIVASWPRAIPNDRQSEVQLALQKVRDIWLNHLRDHNVDPRNDVALSIRWVRPVNSTTDPHLRRKDIARANYPPMCQDPRIGSDLVIHFNDELYGWSLDSSAAELELDVRDIETVALHEFGHLLGLGHRPESESDSIMTPTVPRYQRVPSDKDLERLACRYTNSDPLDPQNGCERDTYPLA